MLKKPQDFPAPKPINYHANYREHLLSASNKAMKHVNLLFITLFFYYYFSPSPISIFPLAQAISTSHLVHHSGLQIDPHLSQPPPFCTPGRASFSGLGLITPSLLTPIKGSSDKDKPHAGARRVPAISHSHFSPYSSPPLSSFGPSYSLSSFLPQGFAHAVPSAWVAIPSA